MTTAAAPSRLSPSDVSSSPNSPTFAYHAPSVRSAARSIGSQQTTVAQPGPVAPTGLPFGDFLRTWTDPQVSQWLDDLKLGHLADVFAENDITGDVLLDLDQAELKDMGIRKVGERVKVVGAIKALKTRCRGGDHDHEVLARNRMALPTPPATAASSIRSGSSPNLSRGAGGGAETESNMMTSLRPRAGSLRQHSRVVPPPLRLAERSDGYGRAYQGVGLAPPNSQLTARSALSPRSAVDTTAPPTLPPPQAQLPAPPKDVPPLPVDALARSARRARIATDPGQTVFPGQTPSTAVMRDRAPTVSSGQGSANVWASGEYGLPRAPGPGNVGSGTPTRKVSSGSTLSNSSSSGSLPGAERRKHADGHRKTPSLSVTNGSPSKLVALHPYAAATSPTADGFTIGPAYATVGQMSATIPATASSTATTVRPAQLNIGPASSTLPSIAEDRPDIGFKVGRGGFSKPTTVGGTVGVAAGTGQVTPHSIDEVKRKTIKVSSDDGESKLINVEGVTSAAEVMERVLRKWGKLGYENDEWSLHVTSIGPDGIMPKSKALDDAEILAICRSTSRPERQRGLTLRRNKGSAKRSAKKLQDFFGEAVPNIAAGSSSFSPTSAHYPAHVHSHGVPFTHVEPASPTPSGGQSTENELPPTPRDSRELATAMLKKNRRASVVSVMSALAIDALRHAPPGSVVDEDLPRPPSGLLASGRGKLRNFFGHRPTSELISDHLVDYFPQVENKGEKKKLSKTVRENVRRSMALNRRTSHFSGTGRASDDGSYAALMANAQAAAAPRSRFSASTIGSDTPPRPGVVDEWSIVAPPMLGDDSASERQSSDSRRSFTPSILEPDRDPASSTDDDLPARPSFRRSHTSTSRYSASSRKARLDSDNASMLTVDEITAEVENRRLSFAGGEADDDDARSSRRSLKSIRRGSTNAILEDDREVGSSGAEDEDEMEEEESQDDDDDDDEGDEDDEGSAEDDEDEAPENDDPQKMTSAGANTSIKWVRGALIGSGSFGSVYLGMHALNGTLMAVKQVERPKGTSTNEERKKNMLSALEREIEFLKELQHPNIVQYLDSSGDPKYVNIFLEYVPGGSVSALLKNYGAFEEALVRTFTRQILQGLNYLHERDIIHRDIKGANILVDNKGVIKISDFGISKRVEDDLVSERGTRVHRLSLQGSVFWMAPEVVKQKSHTRKADIWSLGCLIVEMLTGEHPWPTLTQMQAIFRIGSGSSRPEIPDDVSRECIDILERTFAIDHLARPSARVLLTHQFITLDTSQTPTRASFRVREPVAF